MESFAVIAELTTEKVYFYHDGLRLFTATSKSDGSRYLILCVDETDDADIYMYAPLTSTFNNVEVLESTNLRTIISNSQEGMVYITDTQETMNHLSVNGVLYPVRRIRVADIPHEYLPSENATLKS